MKTKGQQPQVAKLELMAICCFRGGLAEWLNASGCKPVDDVTEALTSAGARIAQPKPYESNNFSIRLLAVELNRRFHNYLPQLPDRRTAPWARP